MVKVYMRTTQKEIPINDIISKGFNEFFTDISQNSGLFDEYKDISRYRVLYCGRVLKEEQLKNLNDFDAIRVTIAPEPQNKQITIPIDPAHKTIIDRQISSIVQPFRNDGRRIPDLHRAFVQPSFSRKLLEAIPELRHDMNLLNILNDYYLFRAYFVNDEYKEDLERNEFKYRNPNIIDILQRFTKYVVASLGMKIVENPLSRRQQQQQQQEQQQSAPAITASLLQHALASALSQQFQPATAPSVASSSSAPAPQAASQPQDEPMQEGYETQAATLRSFGFESEELIQLALEQANGDIQAAMEFLIEMNN